MGAQVSTECETTKEVLFTVHGDLHSVKENADITPETSLNTYLRDYVGLKGTKGMCYEGGCGACIVSASIPHPITKKERMFAVNSCLVPILACHGWNINTVDGIGDRVNGYHPIQTTLAKFNGSQCGYCSGGMVMNMYALYETNDTLTVNDVENSFGGNLCRCTGYRPILDAFKSLATDTDPGLESKFPDIEDIKICTKTGKRCNETCNILGEKPICVGLEDGVNWFKVFTIADILQIFQTIGDSTYRIAAGNTGKGVFRITVEPKIWIDVTSVRELISHGFNHDSNLVLGGNVSLTDTMAIISKVADEYPDNYWHLRKVYIHLDLVANVPVRNIGTIAGNLSLKHANRQFPSDVFLLLETIGATLTIVQRNGYEVVKSLVEYLDFDMNKCIIKSITIPPRNKDTYLFESYKICPRVQNAHAYVNAAFLIKHDGRFNVRSARICFGGINPRFVHARNTEAYLVRKNLIDNRTLQGALDKLNEEVQPNAVLPEASPKFRKNLALSLFYKFVLASAPKGRVNAKFESGGTRLKRTLSKGTQIYQTNTELYPLTQPVNKLEAIIQCSGEAQYLNDTPPIPGELFGAFVLAEAKPLSRVRSVDTSEALKMPGVRAYVNYKDVPGSNSFSPPNLSPTEEVLFVVDRVLYNGQPIGVILADTRDHALNAARFVKVTYNASSDIPALNVKDVLKNNQQSRITNVATVTPTRRGNNVKQVIRGTFEVEGQYHFTMETQSCICIPTDDGGYDVNSATQWMDNVQASAARALNLPMNKINVAVKRLGGAYGAKILRASLVSTACAIASHKVHKPVRIQVPLIENMKMLGKRAPTTFQFEVGVDENGVIQYMDNTYYQDYGLSGMNENFSASLPQYARSGYVFDTWKWNGNTVQTDMPGNAFARGPVTTETIGMIETLMDQISYAVNKDPVEVRLANLRPEESVLSTLAKELMTWSDYDQRVKAAQDFNTRNRWMKKGLSLVIMNYPFVIYGPYSVFMSVFAQDGTVAISHGGIECGQGINTKIAQVCAYTLGVPLDMVSIKQSSSLNAPNNFATGGSITSEAVCYGIIRACREIQRRLEPVKAKMNNPTWKELVLQGHREGIELCATHMFSINADIKPYPIYGVCAAEVQVDLLTGEHNIIRMDLIEDVGQSMSPEIDVGQIEGAVAMGLGYYTCENLIYNDQGQLLTNSTWTYKVPGVKDIPADFRIRFRQNSTNPDGVLNSKAIAEPPLSLTICIPLAIRRALAWARVEADSTAPRFVPNVGPTTVEFTYLNALNNYKAYSL